MFKGRTFQYDIELWSIGGTNSLLLMHRFSYSNSLISFLQAHEKEAIGKILINEVTIHPLQAYRVFRETHFSCFPIRFVCFSLG